MELQVGLVENQYTTDMSHNFNKKSSNDINTGVINMKNKMLILITTLFIFYASNSMSFEGLSNMTIPMDDETISIHYNNKNTTVINKDITDKESMIKTIRLFETKLKTDSNDKYIVDFSEGASGDPQFKVYRNENNKLIYIGYEFGLELTIPSDGYIYISGHTNNMFNKRKKFIIESDHINEIKQPFYYVGLESKALEDVDIFSDINMSNAIAHLVKGTPVSVMLNYNEEYYLIKTDVGLLGWIKIPSGIREETKIEGIYFAGD